MRKKYNIIVVFFVAVISTQCHYDFFLNFAPKNVMKNPNFTWSVDSSQHVKYYFSPNSLAAKEIEQIKDTTEKSISRILSQMHETDYQERIHYFIVESREEMKKLINDETNGAANWKYNGVYYVYGTSVKALGPHEFNHVIASNLWGTDKIERWVSEGFAGYSDNEWHDYDLHSLCKYLLDKQKLVPIQKLTTYFSGYNDLITYPESASFVKYLYEIYGWEKFKRLWKEGSENIHIIYGKELNELEKEWIEILKKYNSININYNT